RFSRDWSSDVCSSDLIVILVDGGPHRPVAPGGNWRPVLAIDQPAATLWFHPHFYPSTAAQVIKGLAGLVIVEDDDTDRLALPSRSEERRVGKEGRRRR